MPLIDRATRLFKADMHAVLDRVEDPEQVFKLAIRDMEEDIARHERSAKLARVRLGEVEAGLRETQGRIGEFDAELDLCFEQARDDLARAVVRKKLLAVAGRRRLEAEAERLGDTLGHLTATVSEQREVLAGYRQKADALCRDDGRASGCRSDEGAGAGDDIPDADIEIALLAERRARSTA